MVAELISVGTEILLGNIVNTNAAHIARECAAAGVSVYYQTSVGDNDERVKEVLATALSRSDVVILTGGLGPTKDDLTKEVVAQGLGLQLVESKEARASIQKYFDQRKIQEISENNWKQAIIIEGATIVPNHNGTAPGLIIEKDEKKVILLPGPPSEMIPMFSETILPYLKSLQPQIIHSVMVKLAGIGESKAAEMVSDLIDAQTNPTIAPYAKTGEVHFRITASAPSVKEAKELIKPMVKELRKRFKEMVYSVDENETLESTVVKLLAEHNLTLASAESCTGGMFAGRIINVPGVSEVFREGFITYSNKAKRKYLDVSKGTLKKYGAVSEQCAKEMVKGAAIGTDSDAAIAITGVAGPDGGTDEKPVGTVYIGCYVNEKVTVKRYNFFGSRSSIREASVTHALDLLRRCILENY